ncbi:NYN domain-containing protein [Gordonibacter massiliensis (ex Traore et al. 2017)]|uniref:NYN domain-containing protein n=1 Tax=Gordonibacter massiliensis (ex Traore et al. 2017) TaxID=1841863 RepID=UPI0021AEBC8C|nr:NYN domain-containing protein [Gordonibacter massiliensis (ex Traore et al. 2017)]
MALRSRSQRDASPGVAQACAAAITTIIEERHHVEKQSSEKRFALLIDADNVSAKYIKPITDELSKYGTVTYKRIYGDWTLTLHAKWKDALLENSITPIQQFGYTQGKNATDSAMIIDAMDILYTRSVEGFCIVSSDSDFTRLASRIRESGLTVIGMGEKKTPTPFRKACDIFTTLELLLGDAGGKSSGRGKGRSDQAGATSGGSGAGTATASKDEIEQAVVNIITDNQNNGKSTGLGEVGSRLLKRYPDFDVRSYGTNLLSKLLDEFQSVQITKDGSSVTVELAGDDRERKNGHGKDAAHGNEAARADVPAEEPQAPKGEASDAQPAEDASAAPVDAAPSDVEAAASDNASDKQDIPADDAEAPEKKPRRSTRMATRRAAQKDAAKASVEQAPDAKAASDAPASEERQPVATQPETVESEPAEEAPVDNRPGRAARKRAAAAWADALKSRKPAKAAQPEKAPAEQGAPAVDQAPKAPGEQEPAAPAKRKPAAKSAKAASPKAKASQTAPKAAEAPVEEPAQPSEAPVPAKAAGKAAGKAQSKRPSSKASSKQTAPKASPKQPARAKAPAKAEPAPTDPEAFIRQAVADAEPDGIALATLGKRVRGKFRTFKLRDLGYAQFRPYLVDMAGIDVEERDGQFYARLAK